MLWKKSRMLIEELYALFSMCETGLEEFGKSLELFYSEGCCDRFIAAVQKVKEWEDSADKQVKKIKDSLYGNFLLPEAREDIARLLNSSDDIIDNAMHSVKYIALRRLSPIPELAEQSVELFCATSACFKTFRASVELLFAPHEGNRVQELVEEVGRFETMCDDVENRMITLLYTLPVDPFTRIVQAEFIRQIGDISNACEDASAIVGIMNLKRVV